MGSINQEQYRRALSRQLNLPYIESLSEDMIDKEIISRVPLNFLLAHQLIPLKEDQGTVTVAMANPLEVQPLDDLRLLLEKEVNPIVCPPDEIVRLANKSYGHAEGAAEAMLEGMEDEDATELVTLTEHAEDLLDIASKAPVIKLVNLILFEAVKVRASDIHIELNRGGIEGIKVSDNGSGIAKDDLKICFLRYTTSKLRRIEDLESLPSLGFRGEALASLVAVSRVTISSRAARSEERRVGKECRSRWSP